MADNQPKSRKPFWRDRLILGIRARLIVLAILIMAPLVFARVHGLEAARIQRNEAARDVVMDLAQRGIQAQREVIYSVRALLQVVAHSYARVPFDDADCDKYLTSLKGNVPWLRGLSIANPNGQIGCSTDANAVGLNVSDRPHFQNALRSKDFALSDYIINRTRQLPALVATYPVIKDDGSVSAVLLAVINLQWIGELAATAAQHSGTAVLLLDGSGTLLAGSAGQENLIGKPFAAQSLAKDMLARDEGTVTTTGFDGISRIFAYARVPWTQARLAVGLDESTVQADIDQELAVAYMQLMLFGLFVLLVAWFGGEQLVVRPIRALVRTAAMFGRGDLHVRAMNESWLPEFRPLAAALDDMALKLAGREEELRIANEHLEELASLDGLTGLANRRGFDRQLELEWKCATERHEPIALMMIDIDHFKLYNDRYGHVAGDTCLRSVGEALSLVTLENAVLVARYGGEEFALLLPGLDLARITELADEARSSIEDLYIAHAEAPSGIVTISIGVESIIPRAGQTTADLVEAADRALYAAKRSGRNRVATSQPAVVTISELEAPLDYELPPSLVA
jgi:diguanylate cyclase (GGDEF)-like protein